MIEEQQQVKGQTSSFEEVVSHIRKEKNDQGDEIKEICQKEEDSTSTGSNTSKAVAKKKSSSKFQSDKSSPSERRNSSTSKNKKSSKNPDLNKKMQHLKRVLSLVEDKVVKADEEKEDEDDYVDDNFEDQCIRGEIKAMLASNDDKSVKTSDGKRVKENEFKSLRARLSSMVLLSGHRSQRGDRKDQVEQHRGGSVSTSSSSVTTNNNDNDSTVEDAIDKTVHLLLKYQDDELLQQRMTTGKPKNVRNFFKFANSFSTKEKQDISCRNSGVTDSISDNNVIENVVEEFFQELAKLLGYTSNVDEVSRTDFVSKPVADTFQSKDCDDTDNYDDDDDDSATRFSDETSDTSSSSSSSSSSKSDKETSKGRQLARFFYYHYIVAKHDKYRNERGEEESSGSSVSSAASSRQMKVTNRTSKNTNKSPLKSIEEEQIPTVISTASSGSSSDNDKETSNQEGQRGKKLGNETKKATRKQGALSKTTKTSWSIYDLMFCPFFRDDVPFESWSKSLSINSLLPPVLRDDLP